MSLTADQVQSYNEQGYLSGITIHDESEVLPFRHAFDELEAIEGREHCQIGLLGRHIDQKFIWELASQPAILDCIEALLGPDILVLSTHCFCKYPQTTQKFVDWHQDVTYWGLEPPDALTAWYAIDDSDVENGCMQAIPGSHRLGILEHGKSTRSGNLLSINQAVNGDFTEDQTLNLDLKAGQISIHHGQLIHGSNPNHSDRRRCGLTLRYCRPSVKPVAENSVGTPWPAVLVRGEDRFKNFGEHELQFA